MGNICLSINFCIIQLGMNDVKNEIIYIGYVTKADTADHVPGISIAGNKMQLNLLEQLKRNGHNIKVISVFPTAPFPKGALLCKTYTQMLLDGIECYYPGFINIPFLKQICQIIFTYLALIRILKDPKKCCLLTYNSFGQVSIPAKWIKKITQVQTVVMFADPPVINKRMSYIRQKFYENAEKQLKSYDAVIALNKNAVAKYMPDKPNIIIEGGIRLEEIPLINTERIKKRKKIIYSGALTFYSGILNLIEAMRLVKNKEICLEIYGGGEIEKIVSEMSQNTGNIKFFGVIEHKKVLKAQQDAFLLVNPRDLDDPISDVTFPSKMFEYLASGTPVLATAISAFTDEWLEVMFWVRSNDAETLAEKIDEILKIGNKEYFDLAVKAQNFIKEKKNWDIQGKKISEFLEL